MLMDTGGIGMLRDDLLKFRMLLKIRHNLPFRLPTFSYLLSMQWAGPLPLDQTLAQKFRKMGSSPF